MFTLIGTSAFSTLWYLSISSPPPPPIVLPPMKTLFVESTMAMIMRVGHGATSGCLKELVSWYAIPDTLLAY